MEPVTLIQTRAGVVVSLLARLELDLLRFDMAAMPSLLWGLLTQATNSHRFSSKLYDRSVFLYFLHEPLSNLTENARQVNHSREVSREIPGQQGDKMTASRPPNAPGLLDHQPRQPASLHETAPPLSVHPLEAPYLIRLSLTLSSGGAPLGVCPGDAHTCRNHNRGPTA